MSFDESWFERIIWTDEKWFVLRSPPHSQNDRYWAPANAHEVVECKKAHDEKIMAWVGSVYGTPQEEKGLRSVFRKMEAIFSICGKMLAVS